MRFVRFHSLVQRKVAKEGHVLELFSCVVKMKKKKVSTMFERAFCMDITENREVGICATFRIVTNIV